MLIGLQHTHAMFRWIVILLAVIAIYRLIMIITQKKDTFGKGDNSILKIFVAFYDIQILIGIIFLIVWAAKSVPLMHYHWEHLVTMLISAGVLHFSARWKKSPAQIRAKNTLIMIIITLVLVFIGVMRLPQGWTLMPSGV